jgi:hypothetical protein
MGIEGVKTCLFTIVPNHFPVLRNRVWTAKECALDHHVKKIAKPNRTSPNPLSYQLSTDLVLYKL